MIHEIEQIVPPQKARFIRIAAENIGSCPEWHTGAAGKAWIFVSEIVVE